MTEPKVQIIASFIETVLEQVPQLEAKMKQCSLFFAALLTLASSTNAQQRGMKSNAQEFSAEKRVALVIGNSAYKDSPLRNPINDADVVAATLKDLGFTILKGENLNQKETKQLIMAFGEMIKSSGVGLFYYAGHGIQSNGRNYLIPIGAMINKEEDIDLESVDAQYVLNEMGAAQNRMNIVILDACRNNPFGRSYRSLNKGLAQMTAPTGTFIAYSTAPGSIAEDGAGKNGLYAQALVDAIKTPSVNLEEAFKRVLSAVKQKSGGKQVPWISSSVEGEFFFRVAGELAGTIESFTGSGGKVAKAITSEQSSDSWLKDLEAKVKKRQQTEEAKKAAEEMRKDSIDALIGQMQADFSRAWDLEKNLLDVKDKAELWKRFLERYKNDVVGDSRDQEIREKASERKWLCNLPDHVTNAFGMEFVLVIPGTFEMGGDEFEGEKPEHPVSVNRVLFMGKYESTKGQWRTSVNAYPSNFT